MKASELRIGNFLLFENEAQEVSSIHSDNTIRLRKTKNDNCHGCYCVDAITINPIPLTEEWLLKLGAKKLSDNFFEIGYLKFKIHSHQYGIDFHFGNGGEHYIKPHYVHSLQNLYFALTGEELTIK